MLSLTLETIASVRAALHNLCFLHVALGILGSRDHRRRRSVLSDTNQSEIRDAASPDTPAPTVREMINTEQYAALEFETPPARASKDSKTSNFIYLAKPNRMVL